MSANSRGQDTKEPEIPELLPCPFCGGAATVESRMRLNQHYTFVGCANESCYVNAHVDFYHSINDAEAPAIAIARWNCRLK